MARVRIVRKDDSKEVAERVVTQLLRHYKTIRLHHSPQDDPWYLEIPEGYEWTDGDAQFLEGLYPDLLAGWHYQDW